MKISFWGVRGSIPTPLSPLQIQNRIAAVVQRVTAKDVTSADAREKFLASLPEWLFGTVGGNTSCVELENGQGDCIVLDAGSGLRELSLNLKNRSGHSSGGMTYHLFFSHYHWDHLQGLPFFAQAFDPRNRIVFYGTEDDFRERLNYQMKPPFFPVPMEGPMGFRASLEFVALTPETGPLRIGDTSVFWKRVNHPGGCTAYRFEENGKSLIYATDTELSRDDFLDTDDNRKFFSDADVLIMDSQYTMDEALEKTGWGHSSFSITVDFALNWRVKKLVLFHHEPTYTDKKIFSLRQSAEWYREYAGSSPVEISIAREGMELTL